jgi:hypothetical protein
MYKLFCADYAEHGVISRIKKYDFNEPNLQYPFSSYDQPISFLHYLLTMPDKVTIKRIVFEGLIGTCICKELVHPISVEQFEKCFDLS